MKERRSYVILVLMCFVLATGSFILSVRQIRSSDHKFCTLMDALSETPVPKPSNPKANPSRERSYEYYVIISELDRSLGCKS